VFLALSAAGCADDDRCCFIEEPATDRSAQPAYAGPGPYAAGVTTLQLTDRLVEVWYPAASGSDTGVAHDTYKQNDPLEPILKNFVGNVARREGINIVFETRAFRGLPASDDRPFPVVLFSHGFGGWRLVNSSVLAGIASWGFVVASADFLERGLNAVATNTAVSDPEKDRAVVLDTLALLMDENETSGGVLAGTMDFDHVGAVGHSAGGETAVDVLQEPEIDTAIGYAAGGGTGGGGKAVMLLVARNDIGITPAFSEGIFAELASPKRLVIVERMGHNSFTDACLALQEGASLTQLAILAGLQIDEELLELGENGCTPEDLLPAEAWAITQHFTVAQLREAFGLDAPAVGLGPGIADAFAVGVEYRQE
jgi:predicted dienelactone hydrolase